MTHYDTLEVSRAASPETIRAAYRSLMQRFHPDRHPGDAASAARAAAVARAYEVLADPQQRAAYDASLHPVGRGVGREAPANGRSAGAGHEGAEPRWAPRPRPGTARASQTPPSTGWARHVAWALLALLVAGGGWTLATLTGARADPRAELVAIRKSFETAGVAEATRRELAGRRQALLERHPQLVSTEAAARAEDLAARKFKLLLAPLVVQVGQDRDPPADPPMQLTLPSASALVGTFDAAALLAHMERHRERLVIDVASRLGREDPRRFSRPDGERQLQRMLQESLSASLSVDPDQTFPSTWFESPGRHGVVAVELPERFQLVQLSSLR